MKNKTSKVIWFTYLQVVKSNWFCLITILGIVGLFLSTQFDKIAKLFGNDTVAQAEGAATDASGSMFMIQFLIVFVLFLLILVYGANIANSVVEEKSARIIETLLCYVKPIELLTGKILGYVFGIFSQVALWVAYYIVLDKTIGMPSNELFNVAAMLDGKAYILIAVSIVLGFIMYAFAFAALASFADNAQDSTQLMMPVGVVIMIAYFISLGVMNGMGGTVTKIISYAPFFSPIVTFVTCDLTRITVSELLIDIAVQVAEVIIVAVICSKIYRRGVISYGLKKPSFKFQPAAKNSSVSRG